MYIYSISIRFHNWEEVAENFQIIYTLTIDQQIQYDEYPDDWQHANWLVSSPHCDI